MPDDEAPPETGALDAESPEAGGGTPPPADGSVEAVELDAVEASGEAEEHDDTFMSASDAKLAEANARYVRLAADFDNYRKRSQRECQELAAGAGEALVKDLLPVLDNLERALAACAEAKVEDGSPHAAAVESVARGVELTLRQFQAVLAKQGVERIQVVGEPFDPHRHEALLQEEREDVTVETVTGELEAGYVLRGRVLRPAKVKVARPSAARPPLKAS
jgi:molecular chaperone GrpE